MGSVDKTGAAIVFNVALSRSRVCACVCLCVCLFQGGEKGNGEHRPTAIETSGPVCVFACVHVPTCVCDLSSGCVRVPECVSV